MRAPLAGVSLSEALAEAATVAPTSRVLLLALEIWHPLMDEAARIVNDQRPMTARIEPGAPRDAGAMVPWAPVTTDATWPSEADSDVPVGRLTIDGVSPILARQLDAIRGTLVPIETLWRLYASDDLEGPARLPVLMLEMSDIEVNDVRVTAICSRPGRGNRRCPAEAYTRLTYPALTS